VGYAGERVGEMIYSTTDMRTLSVRLGEDSEEVANLTNVA
jgi:hypothetical protein